MIPPSKYPVVDRFAAVTVMEWIEIECGYEDDDPALCWGDPNHEDSDPSENFYIRAAKSFTPCASLDDCERVIRRVDENWNRCIWKNLQALKLSAEMRMEVVLKIYFPYKTTEEAIEEIEKGLK